MPDIKEKLVKLLREAKLAYRQYLYEKDCLMRAAKTEQEFETVAEGVEAETSFVADHLITNGVTIQEHDGCVYCKDSESVYHHSSEIHDSMDEDVYISGNSIVVDIGCHSYGTAEIRFCPMCGRKLSEPPKGE